MPIKRVFESADKVFTRISPDKSNSEVMRDTLEIKKLREGVVSLLVEVYQSDLTNWWEDKRIFGLFDRLFTAGVILLPLDPVERVRWIALAAIGMSIMEKFSYGNVLIDIDYLPEEVFDEYDWLYGSDVTEAVINFRKAASEHGWRSLI